MKNPTHEEMNTPIEMSDLPHDVLVSVNSHMAEAMGRSIARDLEAGVYQMKCVSQAIEAFRRLVEVSPLADPHLTNAGLALGKARDELDAYAKAYGVASTDAMPVK
jgi:hypothetical protein